MAEETADISHCEVPLSLVVPKEHVKTVKSALEKADKLDRTLKITAATERDGTSASAGQCMLIPTTFTHPYHGKEQDEPLNPVFEQDLLSRILAGLELNALEDQISLTHTPTISNSNLSNEKNPLLKALEEGVDSLPKDILSSLDITVHQLTTAFPDSYSIYTPMLLLPHNAFTSPPWQILFSAHEPSSPILQPLWAHITTLTHTTHIAINSPIPLQSSSGTNTENILRSPVNITPLYASFGPLPTRQTLTHPTSQDFEEALWVETTQNGIHQTWAPLYTMFSRGNMREKTRLLNLPSVTSLGDEEASVVDLYAGIGYFAFSYKKAAPAQRERERWVRKGVKTVFCFELNAWSVEGLVRGARRNGWTARVFTLEDVRAGKFKEIVEERERLEGVDFVVFQMSNEYAEEVLGRLKEDVVPPVRHVNLGLLPSSRLSWRTAARLVDRERGGWAHVHENVGMEEIEEKKGDVEREFQRLVDEFDAERSGDQGEGRKVRVEHVERVKMYAPGVVHCVFDLCINGGGSSM